MNQFRLESIARMVFIVMMVIGAISLGITWFIDDELHTRFWSNVLHNSVFFTGISFMAVFFLAVCLTAWAGWHTVFKRVWEAFGAFLIPGFILMVLIGVAVYFDANHLYHWADYSLRDTSNPEYDAIIDGKGGFLNKNWYLFGTLVIVGLWIFFARKMRSISLAEDVNGPGENFYYHRQLRKYGAIFLPIAGFSSAAIIWQWVMSVDSHWYSTMFAWYAGSSWFVAMIAMTILVLIYLKSKGYYNNVTTEHLHDLGKFLFAFSIFWTYLWFSQYMLIWYGNVGEETIYFKERQDNYKILFYGNLIINFLVPFFILMRNDTKRKYGTLIFVSAVVFIGHWWDYFLMLKPGILHTAHATLGHGHGDTHDTGHAEAVDHTVGHVAEAAGHGAEHASTFVSGFTIPGILEVGTMIGFLGLFLFVIFNALGKANLVPKNDPYLEESLHHHV